MHLTFGNLRLERQKKHIINIIHISFKSLPLQFIQTMQRNDNGTLATDMRKQTSMQEWSHRRETVHCTWKQNLSFNNEPEEF